MNVCMSACIKEMKQDLKALNHKEKIEYINLMLNLFNQSNDPFFCEDIVWLLTLKRRLIGDNNG